MREAPLAEAKVGDTLFIYSRHDKWLQKVDRVTPTGRVITKSCTFRPDGHMMGQNGGWDRTQARIADADDIAGINRSRLLDKFRGFTWDKLSADDLKTVAEIVARYEFPR